MPANDKARREENAERSVKCHGGEMVARGINDGALNCNSGGRGEQLRRDEQKKKNERERNK